MTTLAALLSVAAFQATARGQGEPLRINTASAAPFVTDDRSGFLDLTIAEIFRRTGRKAQINLYRGASARSIQMAGSGQDDGEALRIEGQERNYPDLIRVPERILFNDFVAYTLPDGPTITTWQDMEGHSVGHIIGWWVFKRNLTAVKDVTEVKAPDQLFSLLKVKRLDVTLYERWQGLWVARSVGVSVRVQEPPLAQQEMFMYLHRKHADLVPQAAQALADMKRDGTYQQIFERALAPLDPTRK